MRFDILTNTTCSGVYCGLVLLQGIACSMGSAALARLQTPAFVLNILSVKKLFLVLSTLFSQIGTGYGLSL